MEANTTMRSYSDQLLMLTEHKIENREQLLSFRAEATAQIPEVIKLRQDMRNALKRAIRASDEAMISKTKYNIDIYTKGVITYGLELMLKLMVIVQGVISKIMTASGIAGSSSTALPQSIIDAIEDCGFWESIPLWAVTLIGGLFITVLSFIMIMSVYGRFFKIYMYSAIAPVPLSTFAGQPTENVGKTFLKSYCAVLLEGAIIVLACVIFSVFASSPPTVDTSAAAVTQVWSYVGELIFNMLVLVGSVKMADRIVREMMGL